jgi:RNA polymerase sigma-70 factor, ECF subfamily
VPHDDWLTTQFEVSRPRLRSLAYRMLGSHDEADDAVQETWIRLDRSDPASVENLQGWLTTVVARICLDRLRSRSSRPEDSAGAPPDHVTATTAGPGDGNGDPADDVVMAESIGAALSVLLDRLSPAERVAFVLHDVFAVPFGAVGQILDRSPDAARQLASRARRRVQGSTTARTVDLVRHREIVDAFLRATQHGDFDALVRLLDPEVELRPDAAALQMGALREMRGAAEVAAALSGGAKAAQRAIVEGLAALVWAPGGHTRGVIEFTIVDERIATIAVTGDADRIAELDIVVIDT